MNKLWILMLLLCVFGCTGYAVKEDSVKIGVIVPLTGDLADYGYAIRNGLLMACDDFGCDFDLIFEDSQYDSALAVLAYNKLVEFDGVDLVINFGSPTTYAIAPLIEDVPVLGFQSANSTVPNLIRTLKQPKDYMDSIKGHLNVERVAILKTQNSYLDALYSSFVDGFDGEVVLFENFQWGEMDFRTAITKIKYSDVDAVGVFLGSGSIAQFYKQSAEMDLQVETFGTDFFESLTEIENAQGTMDGAVYSNFVVSENFSKEYVERFSTKSQLGYAGASYDIVKMLIENVDFSSIMESFSNIENFEGVLGSYGLVEKAGDKYLDYPLVVKEVRGLGVRTLQ
jgi:branched-chain amino acid transport system substrate-binding protein